MVLAVWCLVSGSLVWSSRCGIGTLEIPCQSWVRVMKKIIKLPQHIASGVCSVLFLAALFVLS